MALKDVKNRIKTQLGTVAGIGQVYTRLRNVRDANAESKELLSGGRLHFWMIARESGATRDETVNQNFSEQRDTLVIHGFYALKDSDESEIAFEALCDAVLLAINADRRPPSKLNGTVQVATEPFLRVQDHREVGPSKVLCHHCEIVITVVWRYLQ